jgi:outer membrane murein-binding lipoprotein Lpp
MTVDSIIIPILTFLLGAVITAFSFILSFASRLAKLETKIDTLVSSVSTVCAEQGKLIERTNNNSDRITRLEAQNRNGE